MNIWRRGRDSNPFKIAIESHYTSAHLLLVLHFVLHTLSDSSLILVHSGGENMLIHFFNHVCRAVPHEFRNVLLRNIKEKQLAGVVVSERVEIQMFTYL